MKRSIIHECILILTIIFTGITTGFYLSHSLILGPWFTWFVINPEKLPLLYQTYSEFRAINIPVLYQSICVFQVLIFVILLIFSIIKKRHIPLVSMAFISSISAGIIHILTGFGKLEIDILSGVNRNIQSLEKYSRMNVPLHLIYFILMLISFILLIFYFRKCKVIEEI